MTKIECKKLMMFTLSEKIVDSVGFRLTPQNNGTEQLNITISEMSKDVLYTREGYKIKCNNILTSLDNTLKLLEDRDFNLVVEYR